MPPRGFDAREYTARQSSTRVHALSDKHCHELRAKNAILCELKGRVGVLEGGRKGSGWERVGEKTGV
jgi:hypothetical protein